MSLTLCGVRECSSLAKISPLSLMHIHERRGCVGCQMQMRMQPAYACIRMLSASRFRSFTGPILCIRAVERIIYDLVPECALDCCNDVCRELTRILDSDAGRPPRERTETFAESTSIEIDDY